MVKGRFSLTIWPVPLFRFLVLGFVFTAILARPVISDPGQGKTFSPKNGAFVGVILSRSSIAGSFDGTKNLTDEDQSILLPKISGIMSYGLSFGNRKNWLETEVSFVSFSGHGNWRQLTKKVRYGRLSGTWRFFMIPTTQFQPFMELGWGMSWLKVVDGSRPLDVDGPDFWYADGRFADYFDLHGGAGVAYYINPQFSVRLSGQYRITGYSNSSIQGVAGALYSYPDRRHSANGNLIDFGLRTVYAF